MVIQISMYLNRTNSYFCENSREMLLHYKISVNIETCITGIFELASYGIKSHIWALRLGNYVESNAKPPKLWKWDEYGMELILNERINTIILIHMSGF